MKFNLKNFPKIHKKSALRQSPLVAEIIADYAEWFEGFQQELVEKLAIWETMTSQQIINEILGESP